MWNNHRIAYMLVLMLAIQSALVPVPLHAGCLEQTYEECPGNDEAWEYKETKCRSEFWSCWVLWDCQIKVYYVDINEHIGLELDCERGCNCPIW